MFYEYLIDPALFATWHNKRQYAVFDGRFAPHDSSRVMSFVPKSKYEAAVIKALQELLRDADPASRQAAKKAIDISGCLDLKPALLDDIYKSKLGRVAALESEYERRPFQAGVKCQRR